MDVVPLPERKKHNFLRATKEQLDVLMAGFSASDISSKSHLEVLSEATGLPIKWIASWFTRQRKKVAASSGRVRIQKNATTETVKDHEETTTATTMSIQAIAAFKTEYSEPTLSEPSAPLVDSTPERKPVPSKKPAKKTRKPTKKRASGPTYSHTPSSPLKAPFISAPLPSRSAPSSSEQHCLEAQPQPADRASPTSTFILREMVPVAYKPQNPNPNDSASPSAAAINSRLLESFDPGLPTRCPNLATVSNAIAPLRPDTSFHSHSTISLGPDCNPKALSDESAASRLCCVYPWQDPVRNENPQGSSDNKNSKMAVSQKFQGSLNTTNTLKSCASTSAQTKPVPRIDRSLRPLLPLNSPHWNTLPASYQYLQYYSQVLGTSQAQDDGNAKENRPIHPLPTSVSQTSKKLRSSGPRTLPPLFTNTDLTITRACRSIQSTTSDAIPTSVATWTQTSQQHSFAQIATQSPELPSVDQNENETRFDNQPGSLFDSTSAPLKYLDVLAPFPDETLSADDIMDRLLDPQLAVEDPFQAAMGLVFASQLGLNWGYT